MSYLGNEESLVELPAIEYLENKLGYNFIHGKELTHESGARDSLADVVLVDRLRAVLKSLALRWMKVIKIEQ
ncbi:hypothetical protein [Clostridium sp.]|uniref:hypothetical protein n=1 Tax=Clostridium sp. TaxID=1506 RepID=UPI0025B88296|nr:hypothetical protein [Clostridium sp.]